jgi:hypothetical protein
MKCRTPYCRKSPAPGAHSPYCSACNSRRWKAAHPVNYAYNKLKFRAKERGHAFNLTLETFTRLWNEGLGENRGRFANNVSINRIRPWEGYHDQNVEILTISVNSRLRWVQQRQAENYYGAIA